MDLKLQYARASPGGLAKIHVAGPHTRISDPVGLGWSQEICICNSVPDGADSRITDEKRGSTGGACSLNPQVRTGSEGPTGHPGGRVQSGPIRASLQPTTGKLQLCARRRRGRGQLRATGPARAAADPDPVVPSSLREWAGAGAPTSARDRKSPEPPGRAVTRRPTGRGGPVSLRAFRNSLSLLARRGRAARPGLQRAPGTQ